MTRGSRVASAVFVVLLVASAASIGVVGADATTSRERLSAFASTASETLGASGDAAVSRTVSFSRQPHDQGNVTVSVEYDVGRDAEQLIATVPDGASVESIDGFESGSRYDGWQYVWDQHTGDPSLTVEVPVNKSSGAFSGLDFADTESWTLLRSTAGFSAAYYSDADSEWVYSWRGDDRFRTDFEAAGAAHVSSGMAYLGEHETHSGTAGEQSVTLVVPEAASPGATSEETFALLAESRAAFRFGGVDDHVDVYVGPSPLRKGGYYRGPASFWVHEDSLGNGGTLVHEYVHTRQSYRPSDEMEWFDEGSANYYRELFQYEQGLQSYNSFRSDVVGDGNTTGALANRSTWSAADLEYHRGERVAAALDAKLRQETDGQRTLQDVLRRMNDQSGELGYGDFKRIVAAVAGTSLDGWLDEYVQTDALPPMPDDADYYTLPSPDVDSDGDGLPNADEREHGTSVTARDTDEDGLGDRQEIETHGTDPTDADTDGDGLDDGAEVEKHETDPTVEDTDGDGVDDWAEVESDDLDATDADTDGDGVRDGADPRPADASVAKVTTGTTGLTEATAATAADEEQAAGNVQDAGEGSSSADSPGFGALAALVALAAAALWVAGRE